MKRKSRKSKIKKGGNSIITINNESKKCKSNNNTIGDYSTPETVIITDSYGNRMLPQQQGCPTNPQTPSAVHHQ